MRPREIITATFPVEMQSSLVIKLILPPDYLFLTSVYKSLVAEEGESSLVSYHTFPKPTLPGYLWLRFSVIITLKTQYDALSNLDFVFSYFFQSDFLTTY